jgi:plastocyanin
MASVREKAEMKRHALTGLASLLGMLVLSGCASLDTPVTTRVSQGGERTVELQAGRYRFDPNNIQALDGDRIVLFITNADEKDHNFTIRDPAGKSIQSVHLPAITTLRVRVPLLEPGTYRFYCNDPFHALLGMKGQLVAVRR